MPSSDFYKHFKNALESCISRDDAISVMMLLCDISNIFMNENSKITQSQIPGPKRDVNKILKGKSSENLGGGFKGVEGTFPLGINTFI